MSFIKNKLTSFWNIFVFVCIFVFLFIVWQNFAKADIVKKTSIEKTNSISEFVDKKIEIIFNEALVLSQNDYKQNFDLKSDYSLQKYISDDLVLENIRYVPADLSQIDSEHIVNRAGRPYLRLSAQIAFETMAEDFYLATNKQFYLMSAYRSYNDQATLFEWGCSLSRCAKLGASEHQLWLAVDIHLATKNWYNLLWGEYLKWLNENAHKYWFINTYRKGVKIDGKMKEVWHWRYVWKYLATELFEKDLSFAEYYLSLSN